MKFLKLGLALAVCLNLCGCIIYTKNGGPVTVNFANPTDEAARAYVKLLHVSATVDGSGVIIFTSQDARYEHKNWGPPTNVTINGKAWRDLNRTPAGWRDFTKGLDLSHAWIVKREGRDVIALETTTNGCNLYLVDSPNGAADYSATIAIPRKK